VNRESQAAWEVVVKSVRRETTYVEEEGEVREIRNYLMWSTVLKYFEHGFADKTVLQLQQLMETQRLLKPAKSKEGTYKKFFETDCKICFCSFNSDSNQVLYCDSCNTSFHLACYGLQELPKEDTYYCDACQAQRTLNLKKILCQLCAKPGFPIKDIQGHYYHVTCLMLFNLGTPLPTQSTSKKASSPSAPASPTTRSSRWSSKANSRKPSASSAPTSRARSSASGSSAPSQGAPTAPTPSAPT
jgi:hypothetical protein